MTQKTHPYEIYHAGNIPNKEITEYNHHIRKTNKYLFTYGKPILESQITSPVGSKTTIAYEELIIDAETTMEGIRKYHWVANTFLSPIVSPEVYALLERECGDDFQTFPCEIHATDGIIRDYNILNIVKLVDCMDKERSTPWYSDDAETQIVGYRNIHLYEDCTNCMGNVKLARLKESQFIQLMARSLAKLLKKEKLNKGLRLYEMAH